MRKITQEAARHFENGTHYRNKNTVVEIDCVTGDTVLKLHGYPIAIRDGKTGVLSLNTYGWLTNTTKERLNGLNGVSIQQKKGVWHLNGKEWDGGLIDIK